MKRAEKFHLDFIEDMNVGGVRVFDLPGRRECESARSSLHKWGKCQVPERKFSVRLSDCHIIRVERVR